MRENAQPGARHAGAKMKMLSWMPVGFLFMIFFLASSGAAAQHARPRLQLGVNVGVVRNTVARPVPRNNTGVSIIRSNDQTAACLSFTGCYALKGGIGVGFELGLYNWAEDYTCEFPDSRGNRVQRDVKAKIAVPAFEFSPVVRYAVLNRRVKIFIEGRPGIIFGIGNKEFPLASGYGHTQGVALGGGIRCAFPLSASCSGNVRVGADYAVLNSGSVTRAFEQGYYLWSFPATLGLTF